MTGTPNERSSPITADIIRRALEACGKTHLIITGGRKTGKTTLLTALFPSPTHGITTWAIPRDRVLLRENGTDRTAVVGLYDSTLDTAENRMRVCPDGFLRLGIDALQSCLASDDAWITLDEIGYLETACPEYCEALLALMDKKRVAAVVRKQELPFLQALRKREDALVIDLDAPFGNIGCVIMASGLGVRFGGNKLMADFCGSPMISRALSATDGIFARRVVVTRSEEVSAYCRERGIDVILHDCPGRNDTVRLGLEIMEGTDGCLFCPGDQPLLTRDTVAALALSAANEKASIIRPRNNGEVGAPVLFPSALYGALSALPEGKGGGFVAKQHPELVRCVTVRDPYELIDADTKEQLAVLEAHEKELHNHTTDR